MKIRTTQKNSLFSNILDHSTKSTPSPKAVINELLLGTPIHHTDWTKTHGGEQHRLGLAIFKLRHKYGFGKLIQCPRGSDHPLKDHYFIAPSDLLVAIQIAKDKGLWMGGTA